MTIMTPPRYLKALFQCIEPSGVQLPDRRKMTSQLDPIVISDSDDHSSDSGPESLENAAKYPR